MKGCREVRQLLLVLLFGFFVIGRERIELFKMQMESKVKILEGYRGTIDVSGSQEGAMCGWTEISEVEGIQ